MRVCVCMCSVLHHLSAIGAGRDGIAMEEGFLDTLLTLAKYAHRSPRVAVGLLLTIGV